MVKKRKVRGYRTTWEGFLNLGVLSVGLRKLRNSLRTTGQELALPLLCVCVWGELLQPTLELN